MIITPKVKDKVLSYLVNYPDFEFKSSFSKISNEIGIESKTLQWILNDFEELNLCTVKGDYSNDIVRLSVTVKASDLFLRGGFTAKEHVYQQGLLKLEKELEQLCNKFPGKFDFVNTILGGINTIKLFFA